VHENGKPEAMQLGPWSSPQWAARKRAENVDEGVDGAGDVTLLGLAGCDLGPLHFDLPGPAWPVVRGLAVTRLIRLEGIIPSR
jgi:hypothetical protein